MKRKSKKAKEKKEAQKGPKEMSEEDIVSLNKSKYKGCQSNDVACLVQRDGTSAPSPPERGRRSRAEARKNRGVGGSLLAGGKKEEEGDKGAEEKNEYELQKLDDMSLT